MDSDTFSVVKLLSNADSSPAEYDELVSAWNELCKKAWSNTEASSRFGDIERAAISSMTDVNTKRPAGELGLRVDRMLDSLPHATFMVNDSGTVTAFNATAFQRFSLDNGDKIDDLPVDLAKGESISSIVQQSLNSDAGSTQAILKRATGRLNEQDITLAISPSPGATPAALIFVISTRWQKNAIALLQRQYDLSEAESAVLGLFIDGYSTHDIATNRSRSYSTIRTQFQSILKKTHSRSQTDLLRTSLSVSNFISDVGEITDVMKHPHRRKADLYTDNGRIIEITIMGDPKGKPLVQIPNAALYTLNPEFEQALYEHNLFVISICPPGYGNTDTVPLEMERFQRSKLDLLATLDQLDIQSCPIIATNTSSPVVYQLAAQLPERISHVFQISACPPLKYSQVVGTQSTWANAILNAGQKHPNLRELLLKGGLKAWAAIGAKGFIRLQLAGNNNDLHSSLQPQNADELVHALSTATKYGIDSLYEDSVLAFGDWREHIEELGCNVTIIHGVLDKVFPIESIRALAQDFSEKVDLLEVENVGFSLIFSQANLVVEQYAKYYNESK